MYSKTVIRTNIRELEKHRNRRSCGPQESAAIDGMVHALRWAMGEQKNSLIGLAGKYLENDMREVQTNDS